MTDQPKPNTFRSGPDERGFFGDFGGRFVAETLMPAILELEDAYSVAKDDPTFQEELDDLLQHYGGRPSPLYFADRLTEHLGATQEEVAKRIGLDRSSVANLIRLLELPDEIQQLVKGGAIAMGHARAMVPLADDVAQGVLSHGRIGRRV